MPETSTGLLQRVRDGTDTNSWQRFMDIYRPYLYGWLRRQSLQHEDIEDLVQEVLKTVAESLRDFKHNGQCGAFRCWMRTILVHRLRAFQRSTRIRSPIQANSDLLAMVAEQLEDPKSRLSKTWERDHDQYMARKLLELVEPDFQPTTWKAFRRVVLEASEPEAVAAELGISVESVYAAKSRVLMRLRQESQQFLI
jgi:RNA polymerase sigma-70 factor (ECF subfamily)